MAATQAYKRAPRQTWQLRSGNCQYRRLPAFSDDSQGRCDDVRDRCMQEALPENPFVPGFGADPPEMGQRAEVEEMLIKMLTRLQNAGMGMNSAYLCGPRGTGKRRTTPCPASSSCLPLSKLKRHIEARWKPLAGFATNRGERARFGLG